MAERIGKSTPSWVMNIDINVDVPTLLGVIATGEEHTKHVQAIQVFSAILDEVVKRAIEINDPKLLNLMFKMKLLRVTNNEGENYNDI